MNLVTLLNCCPQGILAQSPAKLEMNSSSVVTCAQLDALCSCGSFPLSQNGFSSPNIAACRVLRVKLQLSSCALLRHFLAPAKALKQKVCRWLRVIYCSVFKLKFLKSSDDGLSHSWTILFSIPFCYCLLSPAIIAQTVSSKTHTMPQCIKQLYSRQRFKTGKTLNALSTSSRMEF